MDTWGGFVSRIRAVLFFLVLPMCLVLLLGLIPRFAFAQESFNTLYLIDSSQGQRLYDRLDLQESDAFTDVLAKQPFKHWVGLYKRYGVKALTNLYYELAQSVQPNRVGDDFLFKLNFSWQRWSGENLSAAEARQANTGNFQIIAESREATIDFLVGVVAWHAVLEHVKLRGFKLHLGVKPQKPLKKADESNPKPQTPLAPVVHAYRIELPADKSAADPDALGDVDFLRADLDWQEDYQQHAKFSKEGKASLYVTHRQSMRKLYPNDKETGNPTVTGMISRKSRDFSSNSFFEPWFEEFEWSTPLRYFVEADPFKGGGNEWA